MSEKIFDKLLTSSEKQSYFFKKFELDVQSTFDEICASKNLSGVKVNSLIKRGNIYLKADYFIPLKSFETFQLNCVELLNKLRENRCLLDVEVDTNYNLTFSFRRSDVYKTVLEEVVKCDGKYGMAERTNTILVLNNNDDSNSFIKARNNLSAKHIISILSANEMGVYYVGDSLPFKTDHKNVTQVTCSEKCVLSDLCIQMKEKLTLSEWKKESKTANDLCIDAKIYLEKNSLLEKYGKDIHSIVISEEDKYDILSKVSCVKHLLNDHIPEKPDNIIYIASHGVNRVVWKVGILLQMLERSIYTQSYIFNQNVKVCDTHELCYDNYILSHKSAIEKAMAHKYDLDVCHDEVWSSRIENLTDSAVKFDFLKLNPNMALKLDLTNCHSTEKNAGIFVQYNFARLSNLFKKFELKVQEGFYDPLQPLNDVDFSLLRLEEEWNLFQYVVLFPKLVERILESLVSETTLKSRYPINGICIMLSELCHYLSLYYSKVRILAGPQKNLQKLMNARLWLLKGIYRVILNSFTLLDIKGLDQM